MLVSAGQRSTCFSNLRLIARRGRKFVVYVLINVQTSEEQIHKV